jgi:hypothetical protein
VSLFEIANTRLKSYEKRDKTKEDFEYERSKSELTFWPNIQASANSMNYVDAAQKLLLK